MDPETLLADGWEECLIGVAEVWLESGGRVQRAVYDADKIIETMVARDGMTHEEAEEFFEFNINGAYVGPRTPIFVRKVDPEEWGDA